MHETSHVLTHESCPQICTDFHVNLWSRNNLMVVVGVVVGVGVRETLFQRSYRTQNHALRIIELFLV